MKTKSVCLLVLFCVCSFNVFSASKKAKPVTKYVAVESAPLKAKASVTGKKICDLSYGLEVTVIEENGNWSKIQLADEEATTGWFISSALTKKKLLEKGSNATTDAKEIALAGKGFSSEVENVLTEENIVDFDAVNKIEKNSIPEESIMQFITEGELYGGEE